MHEEDLAVAHGQARQSLFKIDALVWCVGRLAGAEDVGHADRAEPPRPSHVAAAVGDDGEEPGAEVRAVAKLRKFAPGLGDGVLGGVFRLIPTAQNRECEAQTGFDVRPDEQLELAFVGGGRRLRTHDMNHTFPDTGNSGLVTACRRAFALS